MYVVRLSLPEDKTDFKVFSALPDAKNRFDAGCALVYGADGEDVVGAALFDVPDEADARKAVEAVKNGRATILDCDTWADLQKVVDELFEKEIQAGKLIMAPNSGL